MNFRFHRRAAAQRCVALGIAAVLTNSCDRLTPPPPAIADRLVFLDQPTDVTAGLPMTPGVRVGVVDRNGNPVAIQGQEVVLQLAPSNPRDTLKGLTTALVNQSGHAVFSSLTLDRTATGLRVAAVSKGVTGQISAPFNVNPGAAFQLKFITQPTDVVAGEAITPAPVIEVQDNKGNRVPTYTGGVSVSIRTGVPATIINNTVNCVEGLCTFPQLKITRAAVGFTLIAGTLGGAPLVDATSAVFEVKPGPASKLIFTQNPFNNLVNAVFDPPIRVEVVDTLDNIVRTATSTVNLAFSNNPSGATLGGTLSVAAQNGVVDFTDISVNKAGVNYRLQATSSGLTLANSTFFSIVASGSLRQGFMAPQLFPLVDRSQLRGVGR